jgi:hypothetical protein
MRPRHLGLAALLVALFGAGFIVGKSPAGVDGSYRELDAFVEVLERPRTRRSGRHGSCRAPTG